MKFSKYLLSLLFISFLFTACDDDEEFQKTEQQTTDEIYWANRFAYDALDLYYRWNKEIHNDMQRLDPNTNQDPITTVNEIRYKENGEYVDRWTFLTDDFSSLQETTSGVSTTFGFHPAFYRVKKGDTEIVAVVTYVSKNSPAEKAGLKRGDIICEVNHTKITKDNIYELIYRSSGTFTLGKVEGDKFVPTDKEVTMTAVKMYEDPIIAYNVFTVNEKQVAYLAYAGFDLTSIPRLIEICKEFKAKKATELILDLRYNGGGYVITEELLASMFAPKEVVDARAHYETEEYNETITDLLHKEGAQTKSYFKTTFKVDNKKFSTADANIGLNKIYALVGPNTASASESILIGLMPYIDITIIGTPTHGKYCTGITLDSKELYKPPVPAALDNWGIYVMISVYKNSLGENACIPKGLQPDIIEQDDPLFNPIPLGNMEEPLTLAAVKLAAGEKVPNTRGMETLSPAVQIQTPTRGLRIANHSVIDKILSPRLH